MSGPLRLEVSAVRWMLGLLLMGAVACASSGGPARETATTVSEGATQVQSEVEPAIEPAAACADEETPATERVDACLALLAHTPAATSDLISLMVAERAEAVQTLHALGHSLPLTPELRRALADRLETCVLVDEREGVASLMCQLAMCGDEPAWHPFDLLLPSGALLSQDC